MRRNHPKEISVVDLRKALGVDKANEILDLLAIARGELFTVTPEQVERAREFVQGGGGKGQNQALPALRKFFLTNDAAQQAFLRWADTVPTASKEEVA